MLNKNCPKCHGKGTYFYDHNHSTVCDLCCDHDKGWWLLEEHYGKDNGKWCCKAGCGFTARGADNPGDLLAALCSGEPVIYDGALWTSHLVTSNLCSRVRKPQRTKKRTYRKTCKKGGKRSCKTIYDNPQKSGK